MLGCDVSQKTVQVIIGRVLTDEQLRKEFLVAPFETLSSLRESGLELTEAEIDALTKTDQRLWRAGAAWIDPRLQRCSLNIRAAKTTLMGSGKNLRDGGDAPGIDAIVARVRGEYREMPGLQLTLAQACRLWQVDIATCEMVLEQLVQDRFLRKTNSGPYVVR